MEDWSLQVEGLSIVPPLFSCKRRLNKQRNAFSVINVIIEEFKFSLLRLGIFFAHLLEYSPGAGDVSIEFIYYYNEKITFS